jgi:hypothetical protein
MVSASQSKLELQVVRAAETALPVRHFVTAIDLLVGIGWLSSPVEDWQGGCVPYLERVAGPNFHKITMTMRFFHHWAERRGLTASQTVYVDWTRNRQVLRLSKSGDPAIERA